MPQKCEREVGTDIKERVPNPNFEIKYRLGEEIDFTKEVKPMRIDAIREYVALDEEDK